MALKKAQRLKKEKDIANVLKRGKTARSTFLLVRYIRNGLANRRLCLVVPASLLKKATDRNRFKRIISAVVGANLPKTLDYDILIRLIKKPDQNMDIFRESVREALKSIFL